MPDRLINALLTKGWTYAIISLRAQIAEQRLRDRNLGRRECERLMRVAELEANIQADELYD